MTLLFGLAGNDIQDIWRSQFNTKATHFAGDSTEHKQGSKIQAQKDSKTPLGMSSDEAKPHNTKLIAKCNFQVYPTMSSAKLQLHGRQVHTYQAHKGAHKPLNYLITN